LLPYQIELVVHVLTRARFQAGAGQVAIDQAGQNWILFSLRLMIRTRPARSAAAKSGQNQVTLGNRRRLARQRAWNRLMRHLDPAGRMQHLLGRQK
jgi:hypothetical protein